MIQLSKSDIVVHAGSDYITMRSSLLATVTATTWLKPEQAEELAAALLRAVAEFRHALTTEGSTAPSPTTPGSLSAALRYDLPSEPTSGSCLPSERSSGAPTAPAEAARLE